MLVGIDLGTTNSAIAMFRDGAPVLVPNALGDLLTPSAVSLGDDGAVLVGMAARERQASHPDRTATAFKRLMGTSRKAVLGKRAFSPEDLSALVLSSLKADAEAWSGETVTGAIITVPAYFNDKQRKATRRAGELAGLRVERLVNEPTAAALAYGIFDRADREPFLVFDLGGGTFDVSIVEIFDGIVEVRASAGDNRLGGEDFNEALVALVRDQLGDALPRKLRADEQARLDEQLRAAAERCRRALSGADEAIFGFSWDGERHELTVATAEFEQRVEPLVQRLRDPVLRAMRDSGLDSERLSEIVMVGGATRMPVVRRAVTRMFGRFPATGVHPDHAVALGAAVLAGLRSRDVALKEVRLTDVCPFTLGIEMAERLPDGSVQTGLFSPIIERNTVIPASRAKMFHTMQDNQRRVQVKIYQGEAREVAGNIGLGEIDVPVPPRPAGHVSLECRFSYDVSGLLEVDVTLPDTGETRQLVIHDQDEEGRGVASLAERRAALAALKHHPREDAANAAVLARAERCYADLLGDRREWIGKVILQFQAVLERQDPHAIDTARAELAGILDSIEGERFL
ncbi:Hsp70 family protein [Sphingomonas sp. MAHUQ-71]|uniref:Hsp70 family protein n=1 Tax=Sphingomonas oryzagri TaxID=3042314 RepID=A0ABT6N471_9SPHN|nr:Hsp70 family protein [Sphingomonas oryzagri]